jgi:KipI family sensor histidine kinase inhibitor
VGEKLPFRVLPAGDRALVVEFGDTIDPRLAALVRRLAARLAADRPAGLVETVPTYRSLMVHYDPLAADPAALHAAVVRAAEESAAGQAAAGPPEAAAAHGTGGAAEGSPGARLVEIPVRYGGEAGPDLPDVAERTGLTPAEVIRLHAAPTYLVYMLGFLPGFPYLGGLDPRLATPRLATPRLRIPAGSVGIGGEQTGIYPVESPGGWAIIGRTHLTLFDPTRAEPCLLAPGDRVRFVPVSLEA